MSDAQQLHSHKNIFTITSIYKKKPILFSTLQTRYCVSLTSPLDSSDGREKRIYLTVSAGPSDFLFLGADYK